MLELKPDKAKCIRCGDEMGSGLMNAASHWLVCPKNPHLVKAMTNNYKLSIEKLLNDERAKNERAGRES